MTSCFKIQTKQNAREVAKVQRLRKQDRAMFRIVPKKRQIFTIFQKRTNDQDGSITTKANAEKSFQSMVQNFGKEG